MSIKPKIRAMKIYTEYDAQRRAEEIAAETLSDSINKLEELTQNTLMLIKSNEKLRKKLNEATDNLSRFLNTSIYYQETFNRLPEEMKKEFTKIGNGVITDYNLPFNKCLIEKEGAAPLYKK